jgi:outer membrane biosynthesis protein TonB
MGRLIAALAACVVWAPTAWAQQPSPDQINAIRASCRSDFMANCSGVPRGGAEALACLKQHMAQLSAPCQTAVSAATPKSPAPAAAVPPAPPAPPPAATPAASPAPTTPRPSVATAPPPPPEPKAVSAPPPQKPRAAPPVAPAPARTAVTAPVAPPASQPSQATALGPIPPLPPRARLMILRACGAEQQAYCANVPAGGGRIVDCLAANGASLSPSCRQAILSAR